MPSSPGICSLAATPVSRPPFVALECARCNDMDVCVWGLLIEIVALQEALRADLAACNTALRDGLARWDADKAALRQEVVALGRDRVSECTGGPCCMVVEEVEGRECVG